MLLFLATLAIGLDTIVRDSLLTRIWPWVAFVIFLFGLCCLFIRRPFSRIFCSTLLALFSGWALSHTASHSFYSEARWPQQVGHWIVPLLFIALYIWFTFGERSR